MKLQPAEKAVVIDGVPVLNIDFTQSKFSVSGNVKCIDSADCSSLHVDLSSKGKVVSTLNFDASGNFKFDKVLPGKYVLKVSGDDFCWSKSVIDVDISEKEAKEISFV